MKSWSDVVRRSAVAGVTALVLALLAPATASAAAPGTAVAVGANGFGQLGSPGGATTSPRAVALADPAAIASGRDHAYAVDSAGRVWQEDHESRRWKKTYC